MRRKRMILMVFIAVPVGMGLLLVVGGIFLFSRVSSGYEVVGDQVLFRLFNNLYWKVERRDVPDADFASIQTLSRSGGLYAKDGAHVFFEGTLITDAEPNSFRVLDWRRGFSRDARSVYWQSIRISEDPEHFQVLDGGYSRDQTQVYFASRAVEGADPSSFEVTNPSMGRARDARNSYRHGQTE